MSINSYNKPDWVAFTIIASLFVWCVLSLVAIDQGLIIDSYKPVFSDKMAAIHVYGCLTLACAQLCTLIRIITKSV